MGQARVAYAGGGVRPIEAEGPWIISCSTTASRGSAVHRDPHTVAIPKPIVGSVEVSVLPEQPDSDDDGVGLCLREGEENEEARTEEEIVFHLNAYLQNDDAEAQLDPALLELVENYIDKQREAAILDWKRQHGYPDSGDEEPLALVKLPPAAPAPPSKATRPEDLFIPPMPQKIYSGGRYSTRYG